MSKRKNARVRQSKYVTRNYIANGDGIVSYDQKTGQRTKTNKRGHTFTAEGHWRNPSYGNAVWHPYRQSWTVNLVDTVTYGPNIPGWRDKLQHGEGVVTALSGVKQTLKVTYGGGAATGPLPMTFNVNGSEDHVVGPMAVVFGFNMPQAPTSTSATALQRARTKLLQSYISQVQNFSGGKFLAELKDSIELVTHPVSSVYRKTWEFAGEVKRIGRVYQHRPRTAAAALSESWLAFSFGVKPFIQDANDAARALNTLVQNPRENLRYVSGVGNDFIASSSTSTFISGGGTIIPLGVFNKTIASVRLKGAFRQKPTGTENALSEFGLSVFDIAPSVWEGIPWSFFVDYFTNVSECLDAWRYISVDQAWLISTVRNRATTTVVARDPSMQNVPNGRWYRLDGSTTCEGTSTYVHRSETAFLSETPEFHFKLPGKDPRRLLNIASLVGVINDSRWGSRPKLSNSLTG